MYCHIHHCDHHQCSCVPIDSKETGGSLTQVELLALTQEMKQELKDYTIELKDQVFSYVDVGINPEAIALSMQNLENQDNYILKTLTKAIDTLNSKYSLSVYNIDRRVLINEGFINKYQETMYKMSLSSYVGIDTVDDLINIPITDDLKDTRVFVNKKHSTSIGGGGHFVWDEGFNKTPDNIVSFRSNIQSTGAWVRSLDNNELDDTMFGDTSQAAADAIEYATSNNYNLYITGLLSGRDDGIYYIDGTIKAGIEDGQTSRSIVRGDVTFRPAEQDAELFMECRNWKGGWDGNFRINGMNRLNTGVTFYNCQSFTATDFRVYAVKAWGIKFVGGNNNSFKMDTIAVERCGSKGVAACNVTTTSSGSVSFQRAHIECTLPEDTEIVDIDGNIRRVVGRTEDTIAVFPGLPESVKDIKELTYYRGGGLKITGADGGLLVCQYFRSIANVGISLCLQSLYGALIHKAVFELDQFIAIVIGQSSTGIHYKTTIVDAYFENRYPITILQVFQQSYLDILNGLGVKPGGNVNIREFLQNKVHWGNTDAISTVKLHRADQSPYENADEYLQDYMYQTLSRGFTESRNTLFDMIGSHTNKTLTFKINTTNTTDIIRVTRLKILNAKNSNTVVVELPEGSTIRAYSGVTMKEGEPTRVYTQGSKINEFEIYRLRNNEWIIQQKGIDTEEVFTNSFEDVLITSKESSNELVIAPRTVYRPTDFLTATTTTVNPLLIEKVYIKSNGDICATIHNLSEEDVTGNYSFRVKAEKHI